MPRAIDTPPYMDLLPDAAGPTLRRLELFARSKKRGSINGRHQSPHKGSSVEFAEHREYTPGDDLRNLDWRVFAKNDRHYIRQYVEETNLRCTVVLDASGSMAYAGEEAAPIRGRRASKFEYARHLAAALAYLTVGQRDACGLVTFDTAVREHIRPASKPGQIRLLLEALHGTGPGGDTGVADALHEVAARLPPRGLVVLVSDLFDDPEATAAALHHFGFRKHELVVVHVMAEEELRFPFARFSEFRDLEPAGPPMQVDPSTVRAEYLERVGRFIDRIESTCGRLRADYLPANTSEPYLDVLSEYLARRR